MKIEQDLDHEVCYKALKAHDARFDGRIFVGVSSTGIYCRPICTARLPKSENCTFFRSAASAEAAGYRPCLKCRPELAPGLSPIESSARLARRVAAVLEGGDLDGSGNSLGSLARTFSVSERHLRRVFVEAYGVPPVQYLQTVRLLLSKSLLTDTDLSITEVAMAAGFGSLRRFNDLFRQHYKLSPSDLRKLKSKSTTGITLFLGYRPPYQWETFLDFLSTRAIPGVESVDGQAYRRTAEIKKGATIYRGWFEVVDCAAKHALSVTLSPSLLPVLPQILARVRRLFDVACDPHEIAQSLQSLDQILPGTHLLGVRLPGCFEPFEMSVRAVLGQQVTVKAARTLAMRMASAFGTPIETPYQDLNVTFPDPERICALEQPVADHLGPLGITGARARCIRGLAEAMLDGQVSFAHSADPEIEMNKLLALPGFGPWTVEYIGMRAFGWPDAFPHTDYGVKKALVGRTPAEILQLSQQWRPWRSYATMLLWRSLSQETEVGL